MKNPPHPGRHVRLKYLEPLGLSVTEAARILGVTRANLSNIVNGKSGISPEMAVRLARAFGGSAEIWLRLQAAYGLAQVRRGLPRARTASRSERAGRHVVTPEMGKTGMGLVIMLAFALVVATILIHYEVLRGTSRLIPQLSIPPRSRILIVIAGAFVAHILEICLYALAFFLLHHHAGLGSIAGETEGGALDFLYFSISSFTTLGVGDVIPRGPLRLIAGVEALNGLILIGWSASFTYLAMEKFWDQHRRSPKLRADARPPA